MNVQSLRNTDAKSIEIKLAKVALVTISLWFMAWTPYSFINMSGLLGFMNLSPLATISGSIFAKANAVYNPIVYGLSHPKYKQALADKLPCLSCSKPEPANSAPSEDDNRTTDAEHSVA
uniref:G-protein coupled receptors family 1 profile domain-containing protein n=1 Tax=Megaselia scalaris TaxID=36166 RepID=T1GNY6_MEGSC